MTFNGTTRSLAQQAPKYLLAIAALALLVGVVYGIGWGARKKTTASSGCPGSESLARELRPLARGEVAALNLEASPRAFPAVAFQGPTGEALNMADFKGKSVLLNLWATWCVPCRQEMPALDALQAKLGGARFEVVAVSVDTARLSRRQSFLKEANVRSLAFYADPTAQILRTLKEAGPVVGLPTSFLIGADGCELGVMTGPANWASPDAVALISAAIGKNGSKS